MRRVTSTVLTNAALQRVPSETRRLSSVTNLFEREPAMWTWMNKVIIASLSRHLTPQHDCVTVQGCDSSWSVGCSVVNEDDVQVTNTDVAGLYQNPTLYKMCTMLSCALWYLPVFQDYGLWLWSTSAFHQCMLANYRTLLLRCLLAHPSTEQEIAWLNREKAVGNL